MGFGVVQVPVSSTRQVLVSPNARDKVYMQILQSDDNSKNVQYNDESEFRIVKRSDHPTIYASSHTGCSLGCTMCWLTVNGQTRMKPLTSADIYSRMTALLVDCTPEDRINFAFMARGDALANPHVNGPLVEMLLQASYPNYAKVTISTIFPKNHVGDKIDEFLFFQFGSFQPYLYWSVYSLDKDIRSTLLPNAADPELVAQGLQRWQAITGMEIVVHHALIQDVNSDVEHAWDIAVLLNHYKLKYRVNLVRLNAPNDSMVEASEDDYQKHRSFYEDACGNARIQPRVGVSAYCSCGMFVPST